MQESLVLLQTAPTPFASCLFLSVSSCNVLTLLAVTHTVSTFRTCVRPRDDIHHRHQTCAFDNTWLLVAASPHHVWTTRHGYCPNTYGPPLRVAEVNLRLSANQRFATTHYFEGWRLVPAWPFYFSPDTWRSKAYRPCAAVWYCDI